MKIRNIAWLALLLAAATQAAAQDSRRPLLASASRPVVVSAAKQAEYARPFESTASFETAGPAVRLASFAGITAHRQRFVSEVRLPLVRLWDGRLRLDCVHQRHTFRGLHPAYVHSSGYLASTLYRTGPPLPRARSNYGVTLSFHFGAPARAASPEPGGAGR
jgi:hypothetical protein